MTHRVNQNLLILSLRFILLDVVIDFLYWPIWWYSKGLKGAVQFAFGQIAGEEKRIGLLLWMENLFNPMFAQYDWQGRIISFFMRIIVMIYKTIILALWSVAVFASVILYIFLPIVAFYQIFRTVFFLFT